MLWRKRFEGSGLVCSAIVACGLLAGCVPPGVGEIEPGGLGDDFDKHMAHLPNKAIMPGGKKLIDRYRKERARLTDMDMKSVAALPADARQCSVDEEKYRALLGLDINPETLLIRQYLTKNPSNLNIGFEDFKVFAQGACPNEIDNGEVVFWVEFKQAMKKRPPEVETDIEAARKQYKQWEGDSVKQQKRLEGVFRSGRPSGLFSVITHVFPMESVARQMEQQGRDPADFHVYQYGYLDTDGFDRKNFLHVGEQGSSVGSMLFVALQQEVPNEPGGLNAFFTVSDSSYMDETMVTKEWRRIDEQGRLHGWTYRKGQQEDKVRKACFIRNRPAAPDECRSL